VWRDEWLDARRALLTKEKELTRLRDECNAARRRLPMVRLDKEYVFEGVEYNYRAAATCCSARTTIST